MATQDHAQILTDFFIDFIETKKVLPWTKCWSGGAQGAHKSGTTKKAYQGVNQLILWMHSQVYELEGSEWFTFKAIQGLKGAKLKKGSKGARCYRYQVVDKKKDGEEKSYAFLKSFTLFNSSQIEGYEEEKKEAELVDNNPIESAENVIANWKQCPPITKSKTQDAFYTPNSHTVTIPAIERFKDSESYYCTLFHELVHSTGHKSLLDRDLKGYSSDSKSYAREELVAEIGSSIILSEIGLHNQDLKENSASYLKSWIEHLKNDKGAIMWASGRACKAANMILSLD